MQGGTFHTKEDKRQTTEMVWFKKDKFVSEVLYTSGSEGNKDLALMNIWELSNEKMDVAGQTRLWLLISTEFSSCRSSLIPPAPSAQTSAALCTFQVQPQPLICTKRHLSKALCCHLGDTPCTPSFPKEKLPKLKDKGGKDSLGWKQAEVAILDEWTRHA